MPAKNVDQGNLDKTKEGIHKAMQGLLEKSGDYNLKDHTQIMIVREAVSFVRAEASMIRSDVSDRRTSVIIEQMKLLGFDPPTYLGR